MNKFSREEHGPIFRLDIGHLPTVWICDYAPLREAFRRREFSSRPHHLLPGLALSRGGPDGQGDLSGPTFTNGDTWERQRRLFSQAVVGLGFDKEAVIGQEVERLCRELRERTDIQRGNKIKARSSDW